MAENYASQNAKAWDEIAKIRHRRTKPASHYASGQTTLNQRLIDAAGELDGKSLLQCQCSTGEETLSLAPAPPASTSVLVKSTWPVKRLTKPGSGSGSASATCVIYPMNWRTVRSISSTREAAR